MARRSIFDAAVPLGAASQVYWRHAAPGSLFAGDLTIRPGAGSAPIHTDVIDGAGPSYPRIIRIRDQDGRVIINLSNTLDNDSAEVDELTADAETNIRLCLQYKTHRIVIAIVGDLAEPYAFNPANAADARGFVTIWRADRDRASEPVKIAFVWGGAASRIDFTNFTTRPPPLHLAASLTGRGRMSAVVCTWRLFRVAATPMSSFIVRGNPLEVGAPMTGAVAARSAQQWIAEHGALG